MKAIPWRWMILGAALLMLCFGMFQMLSAQRAEPELEPPAQPPHAPFSRVIGAVGIVEPKTENIAIGAALPGVVLELYYPAEKVGARVAKGAPLFRVDDRSLQAQRALHQANLAAARAELARLAAMPRAETLPPSDAAVRRAEVQVKLLRDRFDRAKQLRQSQTMAISDQDLLERELNYDEAREALAQSQAEFALLKAGAWEPELEIARAAVQQAQAQVAQVETEIERALVRAPVEGEVLQVNIRPGEYVGAPASRTLLVLGDIRTLRVRVDVDEDDIPRFRPNSKAQAFVRGTGNGRPLPLRLVRVEPMVVPKQSLSGANTERVDTRVLQVVYEIDGERTPASESRAASAKAESAPSAPASAAGQQLYVGQQLDVFIESEPGSEPPTG